MATETKQLSGETVRHLTQLVATVEPGDNGTNSKTVPVKILARTAEPVWVHDEDSGIVGYMVHDFATMSVPKSRIPLDYSHDFYQSIGYLNKIAVQDHVLHCSGAVVPYGERDVGAEVVYKMGEGVPYEASIQTSNEFSLAWHEDGATASYNGRSYEGFSPLYVMQDFALKAVAICKFGRDPNSSVQLNSKGLDKQPRAVQVKLHKKDQAMSIENNTAVEATAEVQTTVEAVAEANFTQVEAQPVTPVEETKVEAVEATPAPVVEASAEITAMSETPAAVPASTEVQSVAKQFITFFGAAEGATYMAEGLTLNSAMEKHLKHQANVIKDLSQRLASLDRGAPQPVQFNAAPNEAVTAKPKTLLDVLKARKSK